MIEKCSFKEIFDIWHNHLWPNRISKIESHSAMLMHGTLTLGNFNYDPSYFIYKDNNKILGCNSGHKCQDNSYRSRGLYVFPEFRKQGIGLELLKATINQGKFENCNMIWSYPRRSSWSVYQKAGFALVGDWHECENQINAYCVKLL